MSESTDEVKIYEFSTGIHPERTADGGWVSRGFTGQYMNKTIPEIPDPVERSIANKEFAVAEGASSDKPAVIGRVVGSGDSAWSVVAIVTRGRDEKGRSASLYRYFLCARDDSLPKILAWIEEYKGQYRRMPVFNPFEETKVERILPEIIPAFGSQEIPHPPDFSDPAPVIIKPDEYNELKLHQLHQLAKEKAYDQPIAWAFNVEALEQIRGFQIIQAASDKAHQLLQRAKMNIPQLPVPVVADEQAIKSAIKGLINSSIAKPEYVEAIANSLDNTLIPESYWREIFDGQGADKALKQGLYTDQFVRLLMLRAIVIPKTLPEYLAWLEKVNKQNECYKLAAEFDSQISKSLKQISTAVTNIENNICKGFEILIFSLIDGKISSESANKLLSLDNGLWRKFSRPLIQDIEGDLKLMSQFAYGKKIIFTLNDNKWQNVWQELKFYWRRNYTCKPNHKYLSLAEIFGNLRYTNLSAFFYQIGYGKVPKKIFDKLHSRSCNTDIYELEVQRELTIPEFFVLKSIELLEKNVPVLIVFMLIILSFLGGFKVAKLPSNKITSKADNVEAIHERQETQKNQNSNDFEDNFPKIKQLIYDIAKLTSKPLNLIEKNFVETLDKNKKFQIEINDINLDNQPEKLPKLKKWSDAISEYQKDEGLTQTGEIEQKTFSKIKCEVAGHFKSINNLKECSQSSNVNQGTQPSKK